jgi:outer membrane protein assembly factor BamD
MYADAEALLNKGEWTLAAKKYEDLDRDHPYAPEARRAIVMAAYALLQRRQVPGGHHLGAALPPRCTPAPRMPRSPITSSPRPTSTTSRDPARDQTATRKALAELRFLRQRYPDSPYAKQAENRIRHRRGRLGRLGDEYVRATTKSKATSWPPINRYRTVVTDYQTTAHVEGSALSPGRDQYGARHCCRRPIGRCRARSQLPQFGVVSERLRAPEIRRSSARR